MKLHNIKRIVPLIIMAFFQIAAFAQRGRGFRPEWDIEKSHTYHSIDDDMWSFIFIIGIIVVAFIIAAIKGHNKKNKTIQSYKPSKTFEVIGKIGDGYNTIVGGGCLIAMIIAPIAFLIILVKDCGSDSSDKNKEKTDQRKEKTLVNVILSENNYKQFHEATKDEFTGNDTVYYYENFVYQNKTGRSLSEYLVEYCIDGTFSLEILKIIKPDQFFKSNVTIPFQKPPQTVEFASTYVHYNNWKSQSRWGNKKESKKYLLFLDYTDYVSTVQMKRK